MNNSEVLNILEQVKDPEIPVLSIVDLGVISSLDIHDRDIVVGMTPTFTGCPAIELMRAEVQAVLKENGFEKISVNVTWREPWSSDKISEKGKDALRKFGIAPPGGTSVFHDLEILEHATCPRCSGTSTELRSVFGSTLCRAIHFCNTCKESFEQFKPV